MMTKDPRIGSSLGDFMKEKGLYDGALEHAQKMAFVRQFGSEMKMKRFFKTFMAGKMRTSRARLDRL